jgi:hypothetical protein
LKGAGESSGPIGRFHLDANGDTDSTLGAAYQLRQGNFVRLPVAVGSPGN